MQAFKCALKVVAQHPIYLLVYVGFLSMMGLFITGGLNFGGTSDGYEPAQTPFAVIDRDQSDLSRAVGAFLEDQGTSVEVADEARACQDAVATGQVDYLLVIPAGFGADFLEAARDGAEGPRLAATFSYSSLSGVLVDTQLNQYLGLVRAAAVLEPTASEAAVVARATASAAEQAVVETVAVPGTDAGAEPFLFYLKWSAYPLTVAIVVSVGIVMGAFNRTDLRRRVAVSPVTTLRLGLQKMLAGLVVSAAVWAVIMAIGLAAFADAVACLPVGALGMLLNTELVFTFVPLAMAFLLGQLGCGENVSNTVGNIAGMLLTFLGGTWISLDLMPEAVRVAAAYTPVYWLGEGLNAAMDGPAGTGDMVGAMGILGLFAAAVLVAGLVAGRMRATSAEAGGNAAAAAPR